MDIYIHGHDMRKMENRGAVQQGTGICLFSPANGGVNGDTGIRGYGEQQTEWGKYRRGQ
jgi:hypothetical protein